MITIHFFDAKIVVFYCFSNIKLQFFLFMDNENAQKIDGIRFNMLDIITYVNLSMINLSAPPVCKS